MGAAKRGETAVLNLPEEMGEWAETLGQQNVRKLSVVLLIDLLRLERDPERGPVALDHDPGRAERRLDRWPDVPAP